MFLECARGRGAVAEDGLQPPGPGPAGQSSRHSVL